MNTNIKTMTKTDLEAVLSIPYTSRSASNLAEEHENLFNDICDSFKVEEENLEFRFNIEIAKFVELSEACEIRYKQILANE